MRVVNHITASIALAASLLATPTSGRATAVEALYEGVVTGDMTEAGRGAAATEALHQVVVRVTGRRAAAADPALAGLYSDASRLVQRFRSPAAGQVAVSFDPAALDARLVKAGQRLWSAERPATLVVLVGATHGLLTPATAALRREASSAAQMRGLPLVWPTGLAAAIEELRYQDAQAGRLESLVELARQYGAEGVLLGRVGANAIAWSYGGAAGEVAATGSVTDAVEELADRYGTRLAVASADAGSLVIVVTGIRDLPSYAAVVAALTAIPTIHAVALEEASGTALRFKVAFDGDTDALRRSLRDSTRLQVDETATSAGALQLVLKP